MWQWIRQSKAKNNIKFDGVHRKIVYTEYEKYLKTNNLLDFGDLLIGAVKLLKQPDGAADRFKFSAVFVDEFQDCSEIMLELCILFTKQRLAVFGDADQSIYTFADAMPNIFIALQQRVPVVSVVTLANNYRSSEQINETSKAIIFSDGSSHSKPIRAVYGSGVPVVKRMFKNTDAQFDFVMKEIAVVIKCTELTYNDVCIVFRTNALAIEFANKLTRHKMPFRNVNIYNLSLSLYTTTFIHSFIHLSNTESYR